MRQARTQTFEKGDTNLRNFTKGSANLKKILILRPKFGVYTQFLHDFEIICPGSRCERAGAFWSAVPHVQGM